MALIDKDALVAEINKLTRENELYLDENTSDAVRFQKTGAYSVLCDLRHFINTLEVKKADLDFEQELYKAFGQVKDFTLGMRIAKHFFELGVRVNNPITATDRGTAEEIIINLKRVEKDYHIDLTREIEWLSNKAQKGE